MSCMLVSEYEGTWTLYLGMDVRPENEVDTFDSEPAAVDAAKDREKDVILVKEQGELAGYTRKLEREWGTTYAEVGA